MEYVTIKEAIKLTGKSDKTIRNFISRLKGTENEKHVIAKKGRVYIAKEFLIATYPVVLEELEEKDSKSGKNTNELIEQLRMENAYLKEQLNKANERELQLIQNMRIEQVKTLSDSDKEKIVQALDQNKNKD